VKHIYSTGIIYDRHLQLSKYFYNTVQPPKYFIIKHVAIVFHKMSY